MANAFLHRTSYVTYVFIRVIDGAFLKRRTLEMPTNIDHIRKRLDSKQCGQEQSLVFANQSRGPLEDVHHRDREAPTLTRMATMGALGKVAQRGQVLTSLITAISASTPANVAAADVIVLAELEAVGHLADGLGHRDGGHG